MTALNVSIARMTLDSLLADDAITGEQHAAANELLHSYGIVSADEDGIVIDAEDDGRWLLDWSEVERYPLEGIDDLGSQIDLAD